MSDNHSCLWVEDKVRHAHEYVEVADRDYFVEDLDLQLQFRLEWLDKLEDEQSDDCLSEEKTKLGDKQVSADHHG